jgi:ubiquitin-protein ligase E3 C
MLHLVQPLAPQETNPTIPLLIPLLTTPLNLPLLDVTSLTLSASLFIREILTIPLLPDRFTLNVLSHFSLNLPISPMAPLFSPRLPVPKIVAALKSNTEAKLHLIANLLEFMTLQRGIIWRGALKPCLALLAALMDSLALNTLDPPKLIPTTSSPSDYIDSHYNSYASKHVLAAHRILHSPPPALLPNSIDQHVFRRLSLLSSPAYISSLLTQHVFNVPEFTDFMLSLIGLWPEKKETVISEVVMFPGCDIVRQVWKGHVRSGKLGSDGVNVMGEFFLFISLM